MVKKINVKKYIKEQLEKINSNHKNEVNLETIKFISNYIIENNGDSEMLDLEIEKFIKKLGI